MQQIDDFLDFCAARGFVPEKANFQADGKMVNFLRDGERKYSKYRGAMKVFADGGAAGWIYDFSAGENIEEWHAKSVNNEIDPAELKRRAAERKAIQAAEDKRIEEKQARFARRLTKLWSAIPAPNTVHPYAAAKKVGMGTAKIRKNGEMLIPLRNADGLVTTCQRIPASLDGKWMLTSASGATVKGSYHAIPGETKTSLMIVCEGWATGMSLRRMTGATVVCAMTAGNMLPVAKGLKKKYPSCVFVFAADNDESETGWKQANKAAEAIGGAVVVMPETVGHDFNDAEQADSEAAKKILLDAIDEARKAHTDSAGFNPLPPVEGGVAGNSLERPDEPLDAPPEFSMSPEDWATLDNDSRPEEDEDEEEGEYLRNNRREWDRPHGLPFKILGYAGDRHYYYSMALSRIVEIGAGGHTLQKLWLLADADEWMKAYGMGEKGTILTPKQTYERAISDLIRIAKKMPAFRRERLCRPFGAWKEGSTFVFNGGNRIKKGERIMRMNDNDSVHVYLSPEEDSTVKVSAKPMSREGLLMFVDLCTSFKWMNPVMGEMLAGWTFIAPMCNVLPHRPHLFVTGETGAGKSWAIFNSAVRAIEGAALIAKMSEAKLREKTYQGIRPIIMDESSKRDRDDVRMDQILSLARDAATGKGAVIEVSGKEPAVVKFCACFIASNPPLKNLEDENRFFFLRIMEDTSPKARENFEILQNDVATLFHEGFSDQFIMAAFEALPTVLENARIFKAAMQKHHRARIADVVGMLSAGFWTMTRGTVATPDEALEYITSREWGMSIATETEHEYKGVIDAIMNAKLVEQGVNGRRDVPIWRLIKMSYDGDDLATMILGDAGIRVMRAEKEVMIATGQGVREVLRGTKWQDSFKHFLINVSGAKPFKSRWVNKRDKTSGISLPISACVNLDERDGDLF